MATTTGRRFLQDMGELMAQLQASTAHFVHCVKPNGMEQPELLSHREVPNVVEQLAAASGHLRTSMLSPPTR